MALIHVNESDFREKVLESGGTVLVSLGRDGATTVTTTMMIAHMAGISVFATGGIGGVHRGAETTMDISADLEELAQIALAVWIYTK